MTADGLVELDQSCWAALTKYNLVLATMFGLFALLARALNAPTLLVIENGVLALVFGAVQTYAWVSS